jgi:alpha-L-arabinofuranosidase B-like protein
MHENSRLLANRLRVWSACVAAAAVWGCSSSGPPNDGSSGGLDGSMGGVAASTGGTTVGGQAAGGNVASAGSSTGGTAASGGALSNGGVTSAGGSNSMGGAGAVGGMAGLSSMAGASGGGSTSTGPCDIYAGASTPCVAAHSTTRALYGAYNGALYQLRRASDKATKDVPLLAAGGFVDISVQDTFCSGTTCTISIIYDQSPNKNDLIKSGVATWLPNGGVEANAANGKVTLNGHTAHGIYVTQNSNVAYRNNATKGVAKGDEAEAMYMVLDAKRSSSVCCFDYGNAETSGKDDGNGTMEAVYWGTDTTWGGTGDGSGPWIAADLENGMFKGDKGGWQSQAIHTPSAKSIVASYATAMLKGPSGNHFTLKAGDAQSGTLVTMWDGVRPSPGYSPKKLQGAIIVGTGGDGSNGGTGTFFEGAMTSGNPPDSVDALIQANIVAAGYGH